MTRKQKIAFVASSAKPAQKALERFVRLYDNTSPEEADVIVALGGDGFMLHTLHSSMNLKASVYGMNCGTVGFLMNEYHEENLLERVGNSVEEEINPLAMVTECVDGKRHKSLAINEVSLLRAGPQAAKLRISVDGVVRMDELTCDGALVCTPAGSTAYNYSANGPILPIGSDVLALTAMAAYRPRRWRGALLPKTSKVRFDILDSKKRPVMADADSRSVRDVAWVEITSATNIVLKIMFDPGRGLEERLIQEQFA